jgi:phage tail-like protein
MATERNRPYSSFNYLVDLGDGTDDFKAGFQEVTGLGVEVTMQDYRPGNAKTNATIKLATRYKVNDVTLKRGVLGALDLIEWLNRVRNGEDARRPITIQLQSEDRKDIAMTWRLEGAQPVKYTGPSLNGKGTDVAIEELVLSVEDIKYE